MNTDDLDYVLVLGMFAGEREQKLTGMKLYVPVPGAVKRKCHRCSREIWIGPRQDKPATNEPKAKLTCPVCAALISISAEAADGERPEVRHLGGESSTIIMRDGRQL